MRVLHVIALAILFAAFTACGGGKDESRQAADSTVAESASTTAEELGADEPVDVGVPVEESADLDLRFRFTRGETFGYRLKTVEHAVQTKARKDTTISKDVNHQVTTYDYRFKVLDVRPDGTARMQVTCLRVVFDGTYDGAAGNSTLHYSSDDANNADVERQFSKYNAPVGTPFEMTVEPTGRLGEITSLDEVVKRFLRDDFARTTKESRDLIARDYSEMQIKQVLQLAFQKVPEHPVGIDSTWSISQPSNIGFMSIRNDATYRLTGLSERNGETLAKVAAAMVSSYTGKRKVDTGQGMATMDEFDVKGKGTSLLNIDRGRPERRFLRSDVLVKMYIEPPEELKKLAPEQAQDFWWTQSAYVENTITEIEV